MGLCGHMWRWQQGPGPHKQQEPKTVGNNVSRPCLPPGPTHLHAAPPSQIPFPCAPPSHSAPLGSLLFPHSLPASSYLCPNSHPLLTSPRPALPCPVSRLTTELAIEEEKHVRWREENLRRKTDYIPFAFQLLRALAEGGQLQPLVDRAVEAKRSKSAA